MKRRLTPKKDVVRRLWVSSAGRCQLEGCNVPLSQNPRTQTYMNRSYIAHIYGAERKGPRGDNDLSPEELRTFENLMLLCDACHRTIDREAVKEYDAARLITAKAQHIADIRRLVEQASAPRTQLLLVGSKIGLHDVPLSYRLASAAVLNTHQPNDSSAIEIRIKGLSLEDHQESYWTIQANNLETEFEKQVLSLRATGQPDHFSVFALAPQALLIKLGILLGDLRNVSCYQLNREPAIWGWRDVKGTVSHTVTRVKEGNGPIALKLSLSAKIQNGRVTRLLGENCTIWEVTHIDPNNDYLRSETDLANFRRTLRKAYSQIKDYHGEVGSIHVFPAGPVSAMVEAGRAWMPKADLPLVIYDENKKSDGFIEALSINPQNHLTHV